MQANGEKTNFRGCRRILFLGLDSWTQNVYIVLIYIQFQAVYKLIKLIEAAHGIWMSLLKVLSYLLEKQPSLFHFFLLLSPSYPHFISCIQFSPKVFLSFFSQLQIFYCQTLLVMGGREQKSKGCLLYRLHIDANKMLM